MKWLLSGTQMQAADTYTQEVVGVPSIVLMERAALAVADRICASVRGPENGRSLRAVVIAGKGNNGADALAAGRILTERGAHVTYYVMDCQPAEGTQLHIQEQIVNSYGGDLRQLDREGSMDALRNDYADVYIDGLFGIGLTREVKGVYRAVIETINAAAFANHAAVFAVDIPSGIHAGDGSVCGAAVKADETVTFGYYKRGMYLYPGTTYCGHLTLADIGIPTWSHERAARDPLYADRMQGTTWFTYTHETADDLLPERSPAGNKGTFGKGLLMAGSYRMSGAATMAASAAGRLGCGMVKVFTREENRVIIQETVPEALLSTWHPDDSYMAVTTLAQDLQWADTVAIGPAMGSTDAEVMLLLTVLEHAGEHVRHVIIDADAIRMIANRDLYDFLAEAGNKADVILTPHLAECAALLQTTVSDLRIDRERKIKEFADKHHVTILCKDARSMIVSCGDDRVYLNTSGNDGLATAGSGDVLTGMLTALTAQGLAGLDAAAVASYLHGRLAEQAEIETGRRGLVAPDLYRRLNGTASVVWAEEF